MMASKNVSSRKSKQKSFVEKLRQEFDKRKRPNPPSNITEPLPAKKKRNESVKEEEIAGEKHVSNLTTLNDRVLNAELERAKAVDKVTLFLKNVPKDARFEELKALSPDVVGVRKIPHRNYCFLTFPSEEVCQANFEKLQGQQMNGRTLVVDFCGEKSKHGKEGKSQSASSTSSSNQVNPLELHVSNLPVATSSEDLKQLFPKAVSVSLKAPSQVNLKGSTFAFIRFASEEATWLAFHDGASIQVHGVPIVVQYSRSSGARDFKPQSSTFISS